MGRGVWRLVVVWLGLGLVVGGCGGDDGGEVVTTGATVAVTAVTVAETSTTAAWGEVVAPGAGALVEGSGVLLREDFQDGDTAGWVVEAGWYLLESGDRRMAAAGGEAWAWYGEGLGWSRYGVRLGFLVSGGSLGVSVAVGEGGRYVVQFSPEGVYLLRDAPYGSVRALGSAQPVSLAVAHVLAVGVDGGHVQVYVDGVLLIDVTDGSPLPGGSIGLGAAEGSSVVVDNIVVASLGGPLPELQAVAEPADQPLPDQLADAAPQAGEELEEAPEPAQPGYPNLVMTGVSLPPGVTLAEEFDVSMTVANTGDTDAGPFVVSFVAEGCDGHVAGLAAGEEATTGCRWPGFPSWGGEEEALGWNAWADSGEDIDEGDREDDNLIYGTISLEAGGGEPEELLPNLHVGWWRMDPSYEAVPVGEPIDMTLQVEQTESAWQGDMPTFTVDVLHEDGSRICRVTTGAPDMGGSCEIPGFAAPGRYWVGFVIDSGNTVGESDEDDNDGLIWLDVVESAQNAQPNVWSLDAQPNLWFLTLRLDPANPREGEPFQAVIVMDSNAEADLPAYTVRLFFDNVLVCSQDGRLPRGEYLCRDLTVPPSYTFFGRWGWVAWSVQLDADNDIAESNETDNAGSGFFTMEE